MRIKSSHRDLETLENYISHHLSRPSNKPVRHGGRTKYVHIDGFRCGMFLEVYNRGEAYYLPFTYRGHIVEVKYERSNRLLVHSK